MNGPEHYREAERLLAESRTELRPNDESYCEADRTLAEAQVHATLALVSATAMQATVDGSEPGMAITEYSAWYETAGVGAPRNGGGPAAEAAQPLTVYRASHDAIVMGLYTNAEAPRAHCEGAFRQEIPSLHLDWIEDEEEEDGVAELVAAIGEDERPTSYVVTALTAEAAYDPEADA